MDTTWLTTITFSAQLALYVAALIFLLTPSAARMEYKLIGLALLLSCLAETAGFIGGYLLRVNMNLLYSISGLIISPLWFFFYRHVITSKKVGLIILLMTWGFLLFALTNLFFIQGLTAINSNSAAASAIIKLVLSLVYCYTLIRELPAESITKLPMFWINAAVLILSAGSLLINISTDYLVNVLKDGYISAFTFLSFVVFLHYALLAFGLWMNRVQFLNRVSSN